MPAMAQGQENDNDTQYGSPRPNVLSAKLSSDIRQAWQKHVAHSIQPLGLPAQTHTTDEQNQ